MQYFREVSGRVHAIVNAGIRSDMDVMLSEPLDTQKLKVYQDLKSAGRSDSQVFRTIFPAEPPKVTKEIDTKVEVDVELLSKRQLIYLILDDLQTSLSTLSEMSTADLQKLLISLQKKRRANLY